MEDILLLLIIIQKERKKKKENNMGERGMREKNWRLRENDTKLLRRWYIMHANGSVS